MNFVMPPKSKTTQAANMPSIPGLSFRRSGDEPDFKVLASVIQRSRSADKFDVIDTPEDLANDFRHAQNCDPAKDMIYVEVNGAIVGYCRCQWHERPGGIRTYEHIEHLVPEWRGKGLREVMFRENERRLREIAKGHPSKFTKFFEIRTSSVKNNLRSLVEKEGYRPFSYDFWMVRPNLNDVPELSLPEGLDVRPVVPSHYGAIAKAAEEAFRDEPHYQAEFWTEEGLKFLYESPQFRPEIWEVAWDGDEVAGAVLNFIYPEENKKLNRNWGWNGPIFVRRPYRNRGLASALIARSFDVLRKEGMSEAALMVDSDNPSGANRLYERMGYRIHTQYTIYRKPIR